MSLLIWCPLNGDFKNYGLESSEIVRNTYKAEFSDGGKIGKALYLKESNNGIPRFAIDNPVEYKQSYTIMGWFKTSKFNDTEVASTRKTLISCTTPIQMMSLEISVELSTVGEEKNKIILRIPNCNTEFAFENEWETEVWNHVALIVDGRTYKFFLNGEMIGNVVDELPFYDTPMSATISIGAIGMYYGIRPDEYLNPINGGYVNDIRIYDEILSISQIKEINKCLIAHYSLDGQNLSEDDNTIYDSSGYRNNVVCTEETLPEVSLNSANGQYAMKFKNNSLDLSNMDSLSAFFSTPWTDIQFSVSMWIYVDDNGDTATGMSNILLDGCIRATIGRPMTGTILRTTVYSSQGHIINYQNVRISPMEKNKYNHIVFVYNKGYFAAYINKKSLTNSQIVTESTGNSETPLSFGYDNNGLFLGTYNICANTNDDIRFYTTALTQEDINELYNVKTKIDNKNNLISGNFIEVEDNTDYKKDDLFAGNYGTPFEMSSIYNRVAFNTQDYINDNKQMTVRVTSVKKDEVLVDYLKLDLKNDYLVEKLDKNKRYCFLVDLEINSTGNGEEIQKKRIDFSTYKDDNDDFYECPCIIFSIQKSSAWRVGDTIKISNMRIYEIVTGDEDFDETEPSKNTSKITNKYNVTTNLFVEESNKTKIAEGKITANEIIEI